MIGILLDGFVLLGLMWAFDRTNPNRDFLETGLVALLLVIAAFIMNRFVTPTIGLWALLPYYGLCVFLLWKLPGIAIRRALVIGAVFVVFKVVEPYFFALILGAPGL